MHETLRTSFKLQKEDSEWQCITSDFAYNTFFSIYAKFYYDEDTTIFTPTSCDLRIQNFQGAITLGIDKIESKIKIYYDITVKQYVYLFTIQLKALYANPEIHNQKIDFIKKEEGFYFQENIDKIEGFHSDYLMYIDLKYCNLNPIIRHIDDLEIVDDLRYVRDGEQLLKKEFKLIHPKSTCKDDVDLKGKDGEKVIDPDIQTVQRGIDNRGMNYEFVESKPCRNTYVRFH